MDRTTYRPRNDGGFRRGDQLPKMPGRRSRSPLKRRDEFASPQFGRRPQFTGPRDVPRRNPEFRPRDEPRNNFSVRSDYRAYNMSRTNGQRSFNSERKRPREPLSYDEPSKWARREDVYRRPASSNRSEAPIRSQNPAPGAYRSSQMNHRYEKPTFEREPRPRGMQLMSRPERISNDRYPQQSNTKAFSSERSRNIYRESNRPHWK